MIASAEPETHKNYNNTKRLNDYKPRPLTPDTQFEDLYELYKDAPDIYILREIFETKIEQETKPTPKPTIYINSKHLQLKLKVNLTFQVMIGNGQFERPIGTTLLDFQVADFQFQQNFIVMFKSMTLFFLKMTCVPTRGTLTLDPGHMILSRKKQ